jgi:hypothetical protein
MKQRMRKIGMAIVVAATLASTACSYRMSNVLPKDVAGVWSADDPRYAGRYMELSEAFVIVITGRKDPARVEWVDSVETEPAAAGTKMTIAATERSSGESEKMILLFDPANGGEIRFQNQSVVWRRK